jgi:hypothetical protein
MEHIDSHRKNVHETYHFDVSTEIFQTISISISGIVGQKYEILHMKTYIHLWQYLAMTGFYSGDRLFPLRYKLKTEKNVDDLKKGHNRLEIL